jgi:hypothetical protein
MSQIKNMTSENYVFACDGPSFNVIMNRDPELFKRIVHRDGASSNHWTMNNISRFSSTYTVKKDIDYPVPSRDVTNQNLRRVWCSQLRMGKSLTFSAV